MANKHIISFEDDDSQGSKSTNNPINTSGSSAVKNQVFEKILEKITEILDSQKTEATSSAKIEDTLRDVLNENFKQMDRASESRSKKSAQEGKQYLNISADKRVDAAIDATTRSLSQIFVLLESKGIKISEDKKAAITKDVNSTVKTQLPKETINKLEAIEKGINKLVGLIQKGATTAKTINDVRQGDINVKDIAETAKNIKELATTVKESYKTTQEVKGHIKDLPGAAQKDKDTIAGAVTKINATLDQKIASIKKDAAGDPNKFTKDVMDIIVKTGKQSPALANTDFFKAAEKFSGKIDDIDTIVQASKTVVRDMAKAKAELSKGDYASVAKSIDGLQETLFLLSKSIDPGKDNTKLMAYTDKAGQMFEALGKISSNIDINSEDAKKQLEAIIGGTHTVELKPVIAGKGLSANNVQKQIDTHVGNPKVNVGTNLDITGLKSDMADLSLKDYEVVMTTAPVSKGLRNTGFTPKGRPNIPSANPDGPLPTYKMSVGDVVPPTKDISVNLGKVKLDDSKIIESGIDNVKDLARSLDTLQKTIVKQIDKSTGPDSSWKILRESEKDPVSKYFNLIQGYNKKESGKQFGLRVVDVDALKRVTTGTKDVNNPVQLVNMYKKQFIDKELTSMGDNPERLVNTLGKWVKSMSESDIQNWQGISSDQKVTLSQVKSIENKNQGTEPSKKTDEILGKFSKETLKQLYSATVGEMRANYSLTHPSEDNQKPLMRTLALPAAKLTPSRALTFETAYGSQRILPKFATYRTGFENMYKKLATDEVLDPHKDYATQIKDLGYRPAADKTKDTEVLAKNMLMDLSSAPKAQSRVDVVEQYKKAAVIAANRATEAGKVENPSTVLNKTEDVQKTMSEGFVKGTVSVDKFIEAMDAAGVTATDFVKSMESLDFENIYDVMNRIVTTNTGGGSLIDKLAASPTMEKGYRDFQDSINKLVGTVPIADPARPRRYSHQEKILNLQTMTSPIFDGGTLNTTADDQKQFIRDMNLSLKEYVKNAKLLESSGLATKRLPYDVTNISSLGVPESQAAAIDELRAGGGLTNDEGKKDDVSYLKALNATSLKMYTGDLTTIAPFGEQFQQKGRNIASTTNALTYLGNDPSAPRPEMPSLRSKSEDALIKSGAYGQQGYGYNVTAELRNTASTFEDQVVISGKLADVLTSAVKNIVQPDKLGRIDLTSSGNLSPNSSKDVTDLQAQTLADNAKLLNDSIGEINTEFQKVLGVPQEYKGRADQALLKDVQKTLTVVRNQDLNVQTAKIAETFMNYYGRKFTTRYGSKGVSITSPGDANATVPNASLMNLMANKPIKVLSAEERKKAGLGSAILPKSMGDLVNEILVDAAKKGQISDKTVSGLHNQLAKSGNKFMLSMFTDSSLGVTPKDEADLQQALFEKVKSALEKLNIDLTKDVSGITDVKSAYNELIPNGKTFTEKPIDIRISAYGAAKRGLQTENLETIMNNVAGTGTGGKAVLNNAFAPKVYQGLLGNDSDELSMSKISKALGFSTVSDNKAEVQAEIMKGFEQKKGLISADEAANIEKELAKGKDSVGADKWDDLSAKLKERRDAEKKASSLADLETSSNYYSDVVNEFGKRKKSIVGPKFVEVVEDPHANPAWSAPDIAKQIKGERLNLPAYGAYSSIFGKNSNMMKEISGDIPLDSRKHWEYVKALQTLTKTDDRSQDLLKSAQKVDVKDLGRFTASTGTFIPSLYNSDKSNKLTDTILDTNKYPGAVNLQIPNVNDPNKREDFYIPGALARATYPEPTIAGERGLDLISRRIQRIVEASKDVDVARSTNVDEEGSIPDLTIGRIKNRLTGLRHSAEAITNAAQEKHGGMLSDAEEKSLLDMLNKMMPTLDAASLYRQDGTFDTRMTYNRQYATRGDDIRDIYSRNMHKTGNNKAIAYQKAINYAVDHIIGPSGSPDPNTPQFASRYAPDASLLGQAEFSKENPAEKIEALAKSLNIQPPDKSDELKKALASLERAKIDYYNSLATSVLGKSGSVQELFFTRKVPAVMAKATTAVVDKTKDFSKFKDQLMDIAENSQGLGVNLDDLGDAAATMESISDAHTKTIDAYKSKGLPVLKQHELGIPLSYAKKMPAEFKRRFALQKGKKGNVLQELDPEFQTEGTNFADLMEYREMLQNYKHTLRPNEKSIAEYALKHELQPQIESIRFPFTGTSSVQPYTAKIIKNPMQQHAVLAPGVPDIEPDEENPGIDMSSFDKVKKQVEATLDTLSATREQEQEKDLPDTKRIENLTNTIDKLNKALSDVIPKYVAQQQKLDYDGDQLEIHSAKTKEAREEIAKHYKTIVNYDSSKDTTAQAYRDQFTYGALVPSTGKYTLADQQMAFEKKFPEEEGFKFMKAPFLTEQLEYLKPEQRLDILGQTPGANGEAQGPLTAITELLPKLYADESKRSSIMESLYKVQAPEAGADTIDYSAALLKDLRSQGADIEKAVNSGVREQLFNTKYLNTINAQLFKINTGRDTESLNRILKVFESNVGFRATPTGTKYQTSDEFEKRFPSTLKVTSGNNAEELTTMMNEFIRVGIQKGLDVKHAGETPIATEMAQLISKGPNGVDKLISKVNEGKGSYKDIKEFSDANRKVLQRNLGAMSTEDTLADAVKIAKGHGEDTAPLLKLDRKGLQEYIIKRIGFEGFLKELAQEVEEASYKGIIKSVNSWSDAEKTKKLKGMAPEDYARKIIQKQMSEGGINILQNVEAPETPLYGLRTSSASASRELTAHAKKHGYINHPELYNVMVNEDAPEKVKTSQTDQYKEYSKKLAQAEAVAQNLSEALNTVGSDDRQRSSYDLMSGGAAKQLKADQDRIKRLITATNYASKRAGKDVTDYSIEDRISTQEHRSPLDTMILAQESNYDKKAIIEDYGKVVGVPAIGQEERAQLVNKYAPMATDLAKKRLGPEPVAPDETDPDYKRKNAAYQSSMKAYSTELSRERDKQLSSAIAMHQGDRIIRAARTKVSEDDFIQKLLPMGKVPYDYKAAREAIALDQDKRNTLYTAHTNYSPYVTAPRGIASQGMPIPGQPQISGGVGGGTGGIGGTGGTGGGGLGGGRLMLNAPSDSGVVPVNIVGFSNEYAALFGNGGGFGAATTAYKEPQFVPLAKAMGPKLQRAEEIVRKITGGLNEAEDSDFGQKYRASGLKGGYDSAKQIEAIKKSMLGEEDVKDVMRSSSMLGTAIHAKLEDKYLKEPGTETEKPVRYMSPEAGEVSGTVDVLRKTPEGKIDSVVDIKTISEKNYKVFSDIAQELKSQGKEVNFKNFQEALSKSKVATPYIRDNKLGEVQSQLNLYLKALESEDPDSTKASGYAHFYSNQRGGEGEPIEIKMSFDEDRLKKDMTSIAAARDQIIQENAGLPDDKKKAFAKTSSFENAKKIADHLSKPENQVSDSEIDELMDIASEYYIKAQPKNIGIGSKGFDPSSPAFRRVHDRVMEEWNSKPSLDDMEAAPATPYGSATKDIHKSLAQMHATAKEFQATNGNNVAIEGPNVTRFAKDDKINAAILQELQKVKASGKGGQAYNNLLKDLKENSDIDDAQFMKAWKAYRIAVGDYYVKAMDDARRHMEQQKSGTVEQTTAFNQYKDVVSNFRDTMMNSLGKSTDIYTQDHKYISPVAARHAGVSMSTADLIKRSGGDLGDDPQLKSIFRNLVSFKGDESLVPRDTVGDIVQQLTGLDHELASVYTDEEKVKRLGSDMFEDVDFGKLKSGISRLRSSLTSQLSYNTKDQYTPEQLDYLKQVNSKLGKLEKMYSDVDLSNKSFKTATGENRFPNIIDVPRDLPRDEQESVNQMNLATLRRYFKTPESEGGAKVGDVFQYNKKTYGPNNRVLTNQRVVFQKQGEAFDAVGKKVGLFKEQYKDLNKALGDGNRTFSIAVERVIKWGAAASLVYGGMRYLKDSISQISDIELAMAKLQMVMNPVATNFNALQKSAIDFAKDYGVSVESVLDSMKTFAQQGLPQEDVIGRAKTATVATNVTDLSSSAAAEDLTAAMKVFRTEGESSMRFLDAWSSVESNAAIKAGDLADAIKKSASAGKTAGVTFDQLNGIVAAIGSTTRKTGKEVGTSINFILRRLTGDKGPKALAGLGINIQDQTGNLKGGFDILGELAGKWDTLTRAQKLNVAQAIGGTRQYNSVIVLMDHWDQVTKSVTDSINSNGTASRKNAILMKTYAKQVEQTKAVFAELKIEVGKLVLPSFKAGLKGIRGIMEAINNIPSGIKLAGAAFIAFFTYVSKGQEIIKSLSKTLDLGMLSFRNLKSEFTKGLKISAYEMFGIGDPSKNTDLFGLKTLKKGAKMDELEGSMSQLGLATLNAGRAYNKFLGTTVGDTGKAVAAVGGAIEKIGSFATKLASLAGVATGGIAPIVTTATSVASNVVAKPTKYVGSALKKTGMFASDTVDKYMESFSGPGASAVKSLAPLAGTLAGGALLMPTILKSLKSLAGSAEQYSKEQYGIIDNHQKEIDKLKALGNAYDNLTKAREKVASIQSGEAAKTDIDTGYTSAILKQGDVAKQEREYRNAVARELPGMVARYDDFGNAKLRMSDAGVDEYRGNLSRAKRLQVGFEQGKTISRYTDDLTQTDGLQSGKYLLNEVAQSVPVIGEMIAKGIKVGPKKALVELQKQLNHLMLEKNKNPLSNAFDVAIKELRDKRITLKANFDVDATNLKESIDNINTEGLNNKGIELLFNQPNMTKAFNFLAETNDLYRTNGVTGNQLKGKYLFSRMFNSTADVIEPNATLTTERFKEKGISARPTDAVTGKTSLFSGDYLTFTKDFADKYKIEGRQAIATIDKENQLFISYLNKSTGRFEDLVKMDPAVLDNAVENIFPVNGMIKKADAKITKLNTFVAGAYAGIAGLDKKTLTKRNVSLGPKFFSDIPTEVLLQTDKGYDPVTGQYGTPSYKQGYAEDFNKSYYEPMQKYAQMSDLYKADQAKPEAGIAGYSSESFKDLQNLLENNSVVFQFRAALEDLVKTLEGGQRTLKTNIALEKEHQATQTNASGFMSGIYKGLESFTTGVVNYKDLTANQRVVMDPAGATAASDQRIVNSQLKDLYAQLDAAIKAREDITGIDDPSRAFSNRFKTPEEIDKYREIVGYTAGDKGSAEVVLAVHKNIDEVKESNTKLQDIVKNTGSLVDALRSRRSLTISKKALETSYNTYGDKKGLQISGNLELRRLYKQRDAASKAGDTDLVDSIDSTIQNYAKKFADKLGNAEFIKQATSGLSSPVAGGKFIGSYLYGKGLTMQTFRDLFVSQLQTENGVGATLPGARPNNSLPGYAPYARGIKDPEANPYIKNLDKAIGLEGKGSSMFSSDNMAKGAAVAHITAAFSQLGDADDIKKLDKSMKDLSLEILKNKKADLPTTDLEKKLYATLQVKEDKLDSSDAKDVIRDLAGSAELAYSGARLFGTSEETSRKIIVAVTGIYGTLKAVNHIMGKQDPDYMKKFGDKSADAFEKISNGILNGTMTQDEISSAIKGMGRSGVGFLKDFKAASKNYFGEKTKGIGGQDLNDLPIPMRDKLQEVSNQKEIEGLEKEIRERLDAGGKGKQRAANAALAAAAAMTTINYMNGHADTRSKIASQNNIGDAQAKALYDLASQYPDAVAKVLKSIDAKGTVTGVDSKGDPIYSNPALDVDANRERVTKQIAVIIANIEKQIVSLNSTARRSESFLSFFKTIETRRVNIEAAQRSLNKDLRTMTFNSMYRPTQTVGNVLQGYTGDISLPASSDTLSAQQQLFTGGDSQYQELITNYNKLSKIRDAKLSTLSTVQDSIATNRENAAKAREAGDLDSVVTYQAAMRNDIKLYDKLAAAAKKANKTMEVFVESLKPLVEYQTALKELNNTLSSLAVDQLVKSFSGLGSYIDKLNRLYGGSSPEAPIQITTEEERMGSRVGVPLTNLVSNKYDKREAELRDQLSRSTSSEERAKLSMQLYDLPENRRRDLIAARQSEQNRITNAQSAPYQKFYSGIETILRTSNLDDKSYNDLVNVQKQLKAALEGSLKEVPTSQVIAEYEKYRDKQAPGSQSYRNAQRVLDMLNDPNTPNKIRAGISPESTDMFDSFIEKYKKYLVSDNAKDLKNAVADPLKEELININATTKDILNVLKAQYPNAALAVKEAAQKAAQKEGGTSGPNAMETRSANASKRRENEAPADAAIAPTTSPSVTPAAPLTFMPGQDRRREIAQQRMAQQAQQQIAPIEDGNAIDRRIALSNKRITQASTFTPLEGTAIERRNNLASQRAAAAAVVNKPFTDAEEQDIIDRINTPYGSYGYTPYDAKKLETDALIIGGNEEQQKQARAWKRNHLEFDLDWMLEGNSHMPKVSVQHAGVPDNRAPEEKNFVSAGQKRVEDAQTRQDQSANYAYEGNALDNRRIAAAKRKYEALGLDPALYTARAEGGKITGNGAPKADNIKALLSPGEYVINTASAKQIGYADLDFINNHGKLPKFAEGGVVSADEYIRKWAKAHNTNSKEVRYFVGNSAGAGEVSAADFDARQITTKSLPGEVKSFTGNAQGINEVSNKSFDSFDINRKSKKGEIRSFIGGPGGIKEVANDYFDKTYRNKNVPMGLGYTPAGTSVNPAVFMDGYHDDYSPSSVENSNIPSYSRPNVRGMSSVYGTGEPKDYDPNRIKNRQAKLWGYDTHYAASQRRLTAATDTANLRLATALEDEAKSSHSRKDMIISRRALETNLSNGTYANGAPLGGRISESFDAQRGAYIYTDSFTGAKAGKVSQSAYRQPDASYGVGNMHKDTTPTTYGFGMYKNYKKYAYDNDFSTEDAFKGDVPSGYGVDPLKRRYYAYGKLIYDYKTSLVNKAAALSQERAGFMRNATDAYRDTDAYKATINGYDSNLKTLATQIDDQSAVLKKSLQIMSILRRGGNIFTHPALHPTEQKTVPQYFPNLGPAIDLHDKDGNIIKDDNDQAVQGYKLKNGKYLGARTLQTFKRSFLRDVHDAANIAAAGLTGKANPVIDNSNLVGAAVTATTPRPAATSHANTSAAMRSQFSKNTPGRTASPEQITDLASLLQFGKANNIAPSDLAAVADGAGLEIPDKVRASLMFSTGYSELMQAVNGDSIPKHAYGMPESEPFFRRTQQVEVHPNETILSAKQTSNLIDTLNSPEATKSLEKSSVKLDASDVLKELRDIRLKVEQKPVELDTDSLKKVELKVENKVLSVEDKTFKVDTDSIKLDTSDAAQRLSAAITSAIASATVNVASTGGGTPQGVGADARDSFSEAFNALHDKLINATTVIDDKVKVLSGNIENTVEEALDKKLASKLSTINSEVDKLTIDVAGIKDNVTSQINRVSMETNEVKYLAQQALNFRNIT